jgi:hypothetical protein
MSSLKSYFRRKKHLYETQADLKDMTPYEIENIDPKDIGFYIEQETGVVKLNGDQRRSLYRLLERKRIDKKLAKEGLKSVNFNRSTDTETNAVMRDAALDLIDTHLGSIEDKQKYKELNNRLTKLYVAGKKRTYRKKKREKKRTTKKMKNKRKTRKH